MVIDFAKIEAMTDTERYAFFRTLTKEQNLQIIEHYSEKVYQSTRRFIDASYDKMDKKLVTHEPSKTEAKLLLDRLMK